MVQFIQFKIIASCLYINVFTNLLDVHSYYTDNACVLLHGCWLGRTDPVTPILASLHWLPVHFRIQFKIVFFVFKALNGKAPSYLILLHFHPPDL